MRNLRLGGKQSTAGSQLSQRHKAQGRVSYGGAGYTQGAATRLAVASLKLDHGHAFCSPGFISRGGRQTKSKAGPLLRVSLFQK